MANTLNRYKTTEETIKRLNKEKNKEEKEDRNSGKWARSDWLSFIGLLISIISSVIAINIAIQANSESVTNKQFAELLEKTNKVIGTAEEQLVLNKTAQNAIDNGNKDRFIASIFRLGSFISTRENAQQLDGHEDDQMDDSVHRYVNKILPIFESQMNNPYLCQNDAMLGLWINAYVHLNIVGHEGVYSNAFGPEFDTRIKSRIDELSYIKLRRNFLNVWDAVNEAYIYCGRKIKPESKKFIKQ